MRSNYKIGDVVHPVDVRNGGAVCTNLLGLSMTKEFRPSTSNIVGTDLSKYKVVKYNQFAVDFMSAIRVHRMPIAINRTGEDIIVSPAYGVFAVNDEKTLMPEYLMLWFRRPEFDRYADFRSDSAIRGGYDWDALCDTDIDIPSLPEQEKVVRNYQIISDRIELLHKLNNTLIDAGTFYFKSSFAERNEEYSQFALYDLAGYINGTSFSEDEYSDNGTPIIKIAELKDGITSATQYFVGDKDQKFFIEDGDVLFSWSGNPDTSIDAFIWTHGKGILNQHTFKMDCFYGKAFTFFMLKYCKPEFVKAAQGKQTTGLGHVTVQDLKSLTIPFNLEQADAFNSRMMPMFEQVFKNTKEINILSDMRNQLLVCLS